VVNPKTLRPRLRFRVRTLVLLVAMIAVGLWGALMWFSPTRRLGRLVRADQPAYIRREAASALGHEIPPWEVGQAVSILLSVCDDPEPRVREYAAAGLAQLGPRAEAAVPRLETLLDDGDRFVRYSAAGALGRIVLRNSPLRSRAVAALVPRLDDPDREVRLSAAESLMMMGADRDAAPALVVALSGPDVPLRHRAESIVRQVGGNSPFLASALRAALRSKDPSRREGAFQCLLNFGSAEVLRSDLQLLQRSGDEELSRWAGRSLERLGEVP
jgi:HEAT repeat protein